MAKTRKQKEEALAKIGDVIRDAASAVFVGFSRINVEQETAMRRGFRADGLGYTVAKKSLIRRALTGLGHDHGAVALEGEVAIAYNVGDNADLTAAPRRVHAFAGELGADKISILGGIFEGKLVDALAMREIATIPPVPVLQAMFAQVINSPRTRFAVVLSKVAETKTA